MQERRFDGRQLVEQQVPVHLRLLQDQVDDDQHELKLDVLVRRLPAPVLPGQTSANDDAGRQAPAARHARIV